jgi:hypothetical protein
MCDQLVAIVQLHRICSIQLMENSINGSDELSKCINGIRDPRNEQSQGGAVCELDLGILDNRPQIAIERSSEVGI